MRPASAASARNASHSSGRSAPKSATMRLAAAGIPELRPLHHQPVDPIDVAKPAGAAKRDDGDAPADVALGIHVAAVEPDDVEDEAGRQPETIVGEAGEHEPDEHAAVAGQRRRQDDRASANAGIGPDRQAQPEGDDDGDAVADDPVEARRLEQFARQERAAGKPWQQCADDQRAAELEALARQQRPRGRGRDAR